MGGEGERREGGATEKRRLEARSTTVHAKAPIGIPWHAGWRMECDHSGDNSRRKVQNCCDRQLGKLVDTMARQQVHTHSSVSNGGNGTTTAG